MLLNATNQPKSTVELGYMCPRGLSGPPNIDKIQSRKLNLAGLEQNCTCMHNQITGPNREDRTSWHKIRTAYGQRAERLARYRRRTERYLRESYDLPRTGTLVNKYHFQQICRMFEIYVVALAGLIPLQGDLVFPLE